MSHQVNEGITEDMLQKRVQKSNNMHVAMMTVGEMGHIMPTIQLAASLEQANHTVSIITNKYAEKRVLEIVAQYKLNAKCYFPDNCTRQ